MIAVFGEYFDKIGPTKPKIGNGLKKMDVPAELSIPNHSTSASETSTASASAIDGPIYYQPPPPPPPSPYMCYWNNVRRQKPIFENNDELGIAQLGMDWSRMAGLAMDVLHSRNRNKQED